MVEDGALHDAKRLKALARAGGTDLVDGTVTGAPVVTYGAGADFDLAQFLQSTQPAEIGKMVDEVAAAGVESSVMGVAFEDFEDARDMALAPWTPPHKTVVLTM